jgi:hypothetical protein
MANAKEVDLIRKATGLGWLEAREFLEQQPRLLCERIMKAGETQAARTLHDPIEDDPELSAKISQAKEKANWLFQAWVAERNAEYNRQGLPHMVSQHPRGGCYFVWRETKRILAEEHSITWFSPAEMNPGSVFD